MAQVFRRSGRVRLRKLRVARRSTPKVAETFCLHLVAELKDPRVNLNTRGLF